MEKTLKLLEQEFESSCGSTPQWDKFCLVFKKELKEELEKIGIVDFKFRKGHFYCSGFFQLPDNRIYYFSQSDVRFFVQHKTSLLIRTAESFTDYIGGRNQYINIGIGMFNYLV
jgi:hypothetical protein